MYLLHSASSPHMNLVISLNAPLRKGRTPYPNVVVQFDDKKVIDIEVAMSEEEIEEIEKKNNPDLNTKLQPTMSGKRWNEQGILERIIYVCILDIYMYNMGQTVQESQSLLVIPFFYYQESFMS